MTQFLPPAELTSFSAIVATIRKLFLADAVLQALLPVSLLLLNPLLCSRKTKAAPHLGLRIFNFTLQPLDHAVYL